MDEHTTAEHPEGSVIAVVGVNLDPGNREMQGSNAHVSGLIVKVNGKAKDGIYLGKTQGPAISISGNAVYGDGPGGADILIGVEAFQVHGTPTGYAQIVNNTVASGGHEGIVVDGEYLNVAGNQVSGIPTAGIAAYGPHTYFAQIANNVVSGGSAFGIALDGSLGEGRFDTVSGNTVKEVCQGVVLYNQVDATIASNELSIPAVGWELPGGVCRNSAMVAIPEMIGVRIQRSWNNVYYSNSIGNFDVGFRLFGGIGPEGQGTTANYVGRTWGST